jgi:hypothetical protein
METDKHGFETGFERGSVSRSTAAMKRAFELLRVTDPRSGIRVHPCLSVVEFISGSSTNP